MVKIIVMILHKMLDNEQLVSKLADSYPMRRAAQFLVYMYNKNKVTALEKAKLSQLEGLKLVEKLKKLLEDLEKQGKQLK